MAKFLLANQQNFNAERMNIRNTLVFAEDNYEIKQTLDPDTGKFEVKNNKNNKVLLSINHDGTQNASVLKTYTDAVNTNLQSQLNSHTTSLSSHNTRLTTLESSGTTDGLQTQITSVAGRVSTLESLAGIDDTQSTQIATLQTKVQVLENYINELKTFINAFQQSVYIANDTNTGEFDYTNLL